MWNESDKSGWRAETRRHQGQIKAGTQMGCFIEDVASDAANTRFLEIGTWNGLGSTMRFHSGFLRRKGAPFWFTTLECNLEKVKLAEQVYARSPVRDKIRFVHGKIVDTPDGQITDACDDRNVKSAPLFAPCGRYDVALLDGGDDTTYREYLRLKKHVSLFICDDITAKKCQRVAADLQSSNEYHRVANYPNDRNGWCAYVRRSWSYPFRPNCLIPPE